jgi:16S rRNA (uracil1498-N3)-methyltransferase
MKRFYMSQDADNKGFKGFEAQEVVQLDHTQSKHAWKVLRLTPGDKVQLVDGSGHLAIGVIKQTKPVMSVLIEEVTVIPPLTPRLTLACALPKGGRADDMINQLCQLGLDELIPLNTTRSVVDPRENKLSRFERIITESCKQCGRSHSMLISPTMTLEELAERQFDEKRIGLPTGESVDMPQSSVQTLLLVIGPEGGFTSDEEQWAVDNGFIAWQFAPHILRIETAAAAGISILRSR